MIASQIPAQLKAADELTTTDQAAQVVQKCQEIQESLQIWLKNAAREGELFSPVALLVQNASLWPTVSPSLQFARPLDAMLCMIYWISMLQIGMTIQDLDPLRLMIDPSRFADDLCKVVDYYFRTTSNDTNRATLCRSPLYFAKKWYLRTGSSKVQWCENVEGDLRSTVPHLNWDAILPFGFIALTYIR